MDRIITFFMLFFLSLTTFSQNDIDPANIYTFYYNGVKYEIVKEKKSWADAAFIAYKRGGILVHINNQDEQDTLFFHLNSAGIDPTQTIAMDGGNASYVWIGGNDRENEGKWIWDGSDDGIGEHFWQGTVSGNPVGDLYNNWGNEPDNIGNQDGLGLAITDWPKGTAGEWNDVIITNKLYYVIEYDNSVIHINETDYLHKAKTLLIKGSFPSDFDSLQIIINNVVRNTLSNVAREDSLLNFSFEVDTTSYINIQLNGKKGDKILSSRPKSQIIYVFENPINFYSTDFEYTPEDDFIHENFFIRREFGFTNKAVHSPHNYVESTNNSFSLLHPVIVGSENSILEYSDVAVVEPGEPGSEFGDESFRDYVIVEASKDADTWLPLTPGYDARFDVNWENAWNSPTNVSGFFKKHSLDLKDIFSVGDTILIRFRLFSDDENVGWGWVIDSLNIQSNATSINEIETKPSEFVLKQNYPNPFNPTTTIEYILPDRQAGIPFVMQDLSRSNKSELKFALQTTLKIYDITGKEVATLVNENKAPGNYKVVFNAEGLPTGVYFYRLETNYFSDVKKFVLIK